MTHNVLNAYKVMWLFVFFDLPTNTPQERKLASGFRKELLKDGFNMMQFSVYTRACPSQQNMVMHKNRIEGLIPPAGQVSILSITDKQYGNILNIFGKKPKALKKTPHQLDFFM